MNTSESTAAAPHARFSDYVELTKPRLSFLSVATAGVGFFAVPGPIDWRTFALAMLGTALAAGGVASLNQWLESETDAKMRRTQARPIPSGKIPTGSAFVLGTLMCIASLVLLMETVNGLSALLAVATLVCYLCIYTPMKRWSRWSTEVGAVAGALPPLIGWAAAEEKISALGWLLGGVLLFWQIPHFMAIAWMYRKDYAAVNFPMLAVRDETGRSVAIWSFLNTLALVGVSVWPCVIGEASYFYGALALALGVWFTLRAVLFLKTEGREIAARKLFFASLAYLPIVLAALVLDRRFIL